MEETALAGPRERIKETSSMLPKNDDLKSEAILLN